MFLSGEVTRSRNTLHSGSLNALGVRQFNSPQRAPQSTGEWDVCTTSTKGIHRPRTWEWKMASSSSSPGKNIIAVPQKHRASTRPRDSRCKQLFVRNYIPSCSVVCQSPKAGTNLTSTSVCVDKQTWSIQSLELVYFRALSLFCFIFEREFCYQRSTGGPRTCHIT